MVQLLEPLAHMVRHAPWLTLAWITFVGGCVGSFMNVVVYRLPSGQSLIRPGSRCPACHHAIRWHDNLPVLSWLWLHGRCRDCHSAISPRYPLVELLAMLLFASQWMHDVQYRAATDELGVAVFAFVWHVSLLCVLVCAALIDFDGYTTPPSLLIFGAALPIALTLLAPASTARVLQWEEVSRVWEAVIVGALLAAVTTLVLKLTFPRRGQNRTATTHSHLWTPIALSAMTGLYLGPQRALVTLVMTTLLWRLLRLLRLRSGVGAPWSWYLAALSWLAVAYPS
jgi:leader peptidase (prepilin peptidase)/N-methyltransferase